MHTHTLQHLLLKCACGVFCFLHFVRLTSACLFMLIIYDQCEIFMLCMEVQCEIFVLSMYDQCEIFVLSLYMSNI